MQLSSSLDQPTKEKLTPVLHADFMSSDESVYESESGESDPEHNAPLRSGRKKKLCYHELVWRSTELESYIKSLDRKIERRRSERGQRMVLPVDRDGVMSSRPPPDGAPPWTISPLYEPSDMERVLEGNTEQETTN